MPLRQGAKENRIFDLVHPKENPSDQPNPGRATRPCRTKTGKQEGVVRSRHRVIAPWMEGMTTADAFDPQPAPFPYPIFCNRLQHILGAAWDIDTPGGKQRGNPFLIQADPLQSHSFQHAYSASRLPATWSRGVPERDFRLDNLLDNLRTGFRAGFGAVAFFSVGSAPSWRKRLHSPGHLCPQLLIGQPGSPLPHHKHIIAIR